MVDDLSDLEEDFVRLLRFALAGRRDDVIALGRRTAHGLLKRRPDLARQAQEILVHAGSTATPARLTSARSVPVDSDSRLQLLRIEDPVAISSPPIWPANVEADLNSFLGERRRLGELTLRGLVPTRSLLFVGPPGVGKTLAARWLAHQLVRPLLTLDLSAVMSSFLGRTGNNIRVVLDYARQLPSVLLLDEFDAIAKRRDDATEVGELKRLVTVVLQEVDEWPIDGLLVAATNHSELLDPAVWRRFDMVIDFPLPAQNEIGQVVRNLADSELSESSIEALAAVLKGRSFADITREINRARRHAFLDGLELESALNHAIAVLSHAASRPEKLAFARFLASTGHSQREISELTGLSRDTLRSHAIGRHAQRKVKANGT